MSQQKVVHDAKMRNGDDMEEKSVSKEEVSVDELTERVGPFGVYQIRTQAVFFVFMLPLTYQVLIMYFAAENPPWQCRNGSKSCTYKGKLTSNMGKRFQRRCKLNRSEWEYVSSRKLSIVTEVGRRILEKLRISQVS